jgi:hypothetical protein
LCLHKVDLHDVIGCRDNAKAAGVKHMTAQSDRRGGLPRPMERLVEDNIRDAIYPPS